MPVTSPKLISVLEQQLQLHVGQSVAIQKFIPQQGGSINDCFRIITSCGSFFLKINDAEKYPGMFEKETEGLEVLKRSGLHIPHVIAHDNVNQSSFLLMEDLTNTVSADASSAKQNYSHQLAAGLAQLHNNTSEYYGWKNDNYIGSLPQRNIYTDSSVAFFIQQRLQPMVELAGSKITLSLAKQFEKLYIKLPELLPEEKPALLHGDLWSGNVMRDGKGDAALIDPAVYFGNREADLAMTKLFGGFDSDFYGYYHEISPLIPGWEERTAIWNLYPLMVHVNLFGGSYLTSVKSVLQHYS